MIDFIALLSHIIVTSTVCCVSNIDNFELSEQMDRILTMLIIDNLAVVLQLIQIFDIIRSTREKLYELFIFRCNRWKDTLSN